MNDLLEVNGLPFPLPDSGVSITFSDKTNEYEAENGDITVEVIKECVCKIDYKYKGLTESRLKELRAKIQVINDVKVYDATTGNVLNLKMKAAKDRIKITKVYFRHGISVWGLSFTLEEI